MITNAKVVSINTDPAKYLEQSEPRGSSKFVVSSHVLNELLRNSNRWVRGYSSPESKALKFGSIFDCALLTPQLWPRRYAVLPEDAPRRPSDRQRNAKKPSPESVAAIQWWDEWLTRTNGAEIVSAEDNGSVHAAVTRIRESEVIRDLIDSSAKQVCVTGQWQDKSGIVVPVKCCIDLIPDSSHPVFGNSLWDLKTTQNAAPRQFARDAQKYGYDLQGAFYLDMINCAAGAEQRSDFGHVVIESYAPYEYRVPPPLLSQRFLNFGRLRYQAALALYCRCLQTGEWPSYDREKNSWPITDCEDWFLDMGAIYQDLTEPHEPQEEEEEQNEITEPN